MYESSFGLSDRPFSAAPAARKYFPASAIETARQTLARCVDRAEGAGLVIGPAGSGKSILCQVLAEQFRGRFLVALLASGRLETRRALLQAILFELGLPYRNMDEGELRLSLVDHLTAHETKNGGLLLLIDEAHSLPLRLLEEIHHITNLVRNGQPRVRVVLAGSPVLEEHLGSAKLESFNQRIAARCYLQSFKHEETLGYVRQAISQVGGQPEQIFTVEALDAIHQATGGVPRLINQLCDHALLLAFSAGVKRLAAAGIEEAWADLQQLPTPWNAAPGIEDRPADIIEFGSLDEPAVAARLSPNPEPRLRAVADDDANLFTGEPTQRIERIKDQLGAIDEQFQPAGTIGPEVELVFSNTEINPFEETFEVEEPIVDRFSGTGTDPLARAPVVRSAEGVELSSLLAPHARAKNQPGKSDDAALKSGASSVNPSPAGPRADVAVGTVSPPPVKNVSPAAILPPIIAGIDHSFANCSIEFGSPLSDDEPIANATRKAAPRKSAQHEASTSESSSVTLPIARGWLHPSDDPVMPDDPGIGSFEGHLAEVQPTIRMPQNSTPGRSLPAIERGHAEADAVAPPDLVESQSLAEAEIADVDRVVGALETGDLDDSQLDDVDVIVVEDDPVPAPPPPTTTSAVRRQEYRQLFARLRRG